MKQFIVEDSFWSLFPTARIGVIVAKGMTNSSNEDFESMVKAASKDIPAKIGETELAKHWSISVWRDAYKKFKAPRENRSSIEALIRRVYNGKPVDSINPLVDIYNVVSLKYLLPCGAEDIDTMQGDIRLTRAKGDESFVPLGSEDNLPPLEGEVVYMDDKGIICRCWNWRESDRTKITTSTTNAFLCIECVDENRVQEFEEALNVLKTLLNQYLGGDEQLFIIDKDHPAIQL